MSSAARDAQDAPLDPDALEGVAPPRDAARLLGQAAAEAAFAEAWRGGRRHHAWLLRGPRGIGKASFAYAVARDALTEGLSPDAAERARRQIRAGAHPGLFELRRGFNEKTKKARQSIPVEDVRRLIGFFQLSAAEGGWRVALIDPADDLTTGAANALLKLLEEPPARALFLLVAHAAGRLPATVRSRCRRLDFAPLSYQHTAEAMRAAQPDLPQEEAAAMALLSEGAPGEALRLAAAGGLALYHDAMRFLEAPADPARQRPLIEAASKRETQPPGFETVTRLLPLLIARLARHPYRDADDQALIAAVLPEETEAVARLCRSDAAARAWAEAAAETRERLGAALGLHLDPGRAILDTALYLDEIARRAQRL